MTNYSLWVRSSCGLSSYVLWVKKGFIFLKVLKQRICDSDHMWPPKLKYLSFAPLQKKSVHHGLKQQLWTVQSCSQHTVGQFEGALFRDQAGWSPAYLLPHQRRGGGSLEKHPSALKALSPERHMLLLLRAQWSKQAEFPRVRLCSFFRENMSEQLDVSCDYYTEG